MSEAGAHLSVALKHRLGSLQIDAAFELTKPWTVLFGPSGSGKSTILRAVAGLLLPEQARIVLRRNGREEIVSNSPGRVFVPAHRRPIRWCAQRPALFPNMTVRENLRFAAEANGPDAVQRVEMALDRFHLTALARSRSATLSGGEQQRVALARAAVSSEGRLLLLDEPFSGLDVPLRDDLLRALRDWLAEHNTPVLSVTHDIGEAFLLGGEVIRLHQGRVIEQGPVEVVLAAERTRLLKQLG